MDKRGIRGEEDEETDAEAKNEETRRNTRTQHEVKARLLSPLATGPTPPYQGELGKRNFYPNRMESSL